MVGGWVGRAYRALTVLNDELLFCTVLGFLFNFCNVDVLTCKFQIQMNVPKRSLMCTSTNSGFN